MTAAVSEQAALFGCRNSLVGIFTRPLGPAATDRPTIVVLNTGIIHRVGHHRMYVDMARILAADGYPVLRFDLSGIGDSGPRQESLPLLETAMIDITEALDWIEATSGARRIVLLGLCSGADQAIAYGYTDDRIVGLVLLDPSVPATWRHYLRYVAPRLTKLQSWIALFTFRSRTVRNWISGGLEKVGLLALRGSRPTALPSEHLARDFITHYYQGAVRKSIRMLAVFTGEPTRQTYREQLIEALPNVRFGDLLQLEYVARSDHTFILETDRTWLNALILQWLAADA